MKYFKVSKNLQHFRLKTIRVKERIELSKREPEIFFFLEKN